ncbi:MAG: ABC transporter C-terminal domain-containing protein, partial [Nitrospira sp.]|nr:ABC transporter C-terminal domain-containing protein [Nitrospira sp.]
GTGRTDWFADYAQWESAQERAGGSAPESKSDGRSAVQNETTSAIPARKPKKLSYREQKEWGTIEDNILKAEKQVAACEAALHDPAIISDAGELQARGQALAAAQAEVDRLYVRWAELDQKRAQLQEN